MQMCSGITRGRVLNGELYAQRFQKLIYLHLYMFHEDFSSIIGINSSVLDLTIEKKSSGNSNADK